MKIFSGKKQFEVLDECLFPGALRIKVFAICNLKKNQDQFMIREKSLRKLYYYLKEVGFRSTFLKVLSRTREKIRNEKYFSMGIGKIIQSSSEHFPVEKIVYFIASNHAKCPERVVVHENFVFLDTAAKLPWILESALFVVKNTYQDEEWGSAVAWSPYSGILAPSIDATIKEKISHFWASVLIKNARQISFNSSNIISEAKMPRKKKIVLQKNAVLFGYGNYAKTMLLPHLNKKISVTSIHEIDSTQLLPLKNNIHYDTSPTPRLDSQHNVYFIAGYHHTHTDIAITGLQKGASVVVEKPLMTNKQDLEKLIMAMKNSQSNFYACFQRRYHRFNDYIFQDFKLKSGDPISYYAIIYEESLPQLHWYRWPNSRSAIISNGCHWIDHFLFLNHFSPVSAYSALKTKKGEIIIFVELDNGAALSLTLSHLGSARIGMQEYIELRSAQNTAKITNGKVYQSENSTRVIRRSSVHKYESYRKMYQTISNHIVDKNAFSCNDSWEKVNSVSSLILSLDEAVVTTN